MRPWWISCFFLFLRASVPCTCFLTLHPFQAPAAGVAAGRPTSVGAARVGKGGQQLREAAGAGEPQIRIGHGYDIHRLAEGKELVIGGVTIPHTKGADAHSDGDVVYHSIVDAILGALGTNLDIGMLFPDNDPEWSGADSSIFMKEAYSRMVERGYSIGNVDVTLILQQPKVMGFKPAMKANIVDQLHTVDDRVNVKARTHEKVDSVGRGEAMECHVVLTLEKTT